MGTPIFHCVLGTVVMLAVGCGAEFADIDDDLPARSYPAEEQTNEARRILLEVAAKAATSERAFAEAQSSAGVYLTPGRPEVIARIALSFQALGDEDRARDLAKRVVRIDREPVFMYSAFFSREDRSVVAQAISLVDGCDAVNPQDLSRNSYGLMGQHGLLGRVCADQPAALDRVLARVRDSNVKQDVMLAAADASLATPYEVAMSSLRVLEDHVDGLADAPVEQARVLARLAYVTRYLGQRKRSYHLMVRAQALASNFNFDKDVEIMESVMELAQFAYITNQPRELCIRAPLKGPAHPFFRLWVSLRCAGGLARHGAKDTGYALMRDAFAQVLAAQAQSGATAPFEVMLAPADIHLYYALVAGDAGDSARADSEMATLISRVGPPVTDDVTSWRLQGIASILARAPSTGLPKTLAALRPSLQKRTTPWPRKLVDEPAGELNTVTSRAVTPSAAKLATIAEREEAPEEIYSASEHHEHMRLQVVGAAGAAYARAGDHKFAERLADITTSPLVRARILRELALAYYRAGQYPRAAGLLQRVSKIALASTVPSDENKPEYLPTPRQVGPVFVDTVDALLKIDHTEDALRLVAMANSRESMLAGLLHIIDHRSARKLSKSVASEYGQRLLQRFRRLEDLLLNQNKSGATSNLAN